MVDSNIKNVTIKSAELPLIQIATKYVPANVRDEIDYLFYNFRYRVISEDKNRFSQWSNIEKITMPGVGSGMNNGVPYFPYTATARISTIKDANNVVTTIWNKVSNDVASDFEKIFNKITIFDVWVRWNTASTTDPNGAGWTTWEYRTMVSTNSYSIINPIPTGAGQYHSFDIAIQVPSSLKIRDYSDTQLTLYRKTSVI